MEKFEYKIHECDDRDLKNETLNEFGREGWKLVSHNAVAQLEDEYRYTIWHYFVYCRLLVDSEDVSRDDDGWSYDEWQEHQKEIAKLARELREISEQ